MRTNLHIVYRRLFSIVICYFQKIEINNLHTIFKILNYQNALILRKIHTNQVQTFNFCIQFIGNSSQN